MTSPEQRRSEAPIFTDEDKARWKEEFHTFHGIYLSEEEGEAILARLEAAETAVRRAELFILGGTAGGDIHWTDFKDSYEAWRKAVGK